MDALQSHAGECECNPAKLPDWMVSKAPRKSSDDLDQEGTTSLRMRLFKSGKADLLGTAATGEFSIFSNTEPSHSSPGIQPMSELVKDFVTSSDVRLRNMYPLPDRPAEQSFIDLSDDSD